MLFYGTFLPLHGMDVLLHACKRLEGKPIEFRIIGGTGKALAGFQSLLAELQPGNVVHDTWVDFEELQPMSSRAPTYVSAAPLAERRRRCA